MATVIVEVTQDQYDLGDHYDKAEITLESEGFSKPMVLFDEHEAKEVPGLVNLAEQNCNLNNFNYP